MTNPLILRESRRKRSRRNLKPKNSEWLIVCGGEKTEVYYINGLIRYVNQFCDQENQLSVKVVGLSVDPKNLVEELRRKIIQCCDAKLIRFSKIFVVFDKDDFQNNQFNQALEMCHENDYIACYSNECFEVWLYLHFHTLNTLIPRQQLVSKISKYLWNHGSSEYQKNDCNLFEKMRVHGDILKAITRAEQLERSQSSFSPSKKVPVTMMHYLLKEIDFRQRELELPGIHEMFTKKKGCIIFSVCNV